MTNVSFTSLLKQLHLTWLLHLDWSRWKTDWYIWLVILAFCLFLRVVAGFWSPKRQQFPSIDHIPRNPFEEGLNLIFVSANLDPDEEAFFEVRSRWIRMKSRRTNFGAASIRIGRVRLSGGQAVRQGEEPTIISNGRLIGTNKRLLFVGDARSTSIDWVDVVELLSGKDYLSAAVLGRDTEYFSVDQAKKNATKIELS